MDKQALLVMLEDIAPPELFEGVECAQGTKELLPLLDAELQRCSNRMQRIQEYRNKLSSPMYSLLPELLSRIFIIYATEGNELFNMRWSRLLLVCRRWYDVGVSTPMLWSHISLLDSSSLGSYHVRGAQTDLRIVNRVKAQLARAGGSPLTIKTGTSAHQGDISDILQPYQSIWWDSNTLKSFTVTGGHGHVSGLLREMASHRHPILKDLDVVLTRAGLRSWMAAGPPPSSPSRASNIALPDGLLGDGAPQLSSLCLDGIRPNWALIQNLRVLHTSFDDNAVPATSLQSIADAIERCPRLKDLRMVLPKNFTPPDMNLSTTISLKRLRKVSMTGNADVCAGLLQSFVDLPPSARISLVLSSTSSLQQISLLSSILGVHTRQDDTPTIRSVSVTTNPALVQHLGPNVNMNLDMLNGQGADLRAVQLCVSGSTQLDRHPPLDIPFSMKLSDALYTSLSAVPNSETTTEIALAHILQSWQLTNATFIDMRACRIMSATMWRVLFDNVPSATTVVLPPESHSLTSLLELLNSSLRTEKRRIVRNIILDLGDIGRNAQVSFLFGAAGATATHESPALRAHINLIRVLQYCSEAAQAGVPLDSVELVNDDMETHVAKRVIQPSPELDWSELYCDLSEGFVYEGILRNAKTGPEGVERDLFTGSKITKETQALLRSLFY